MTNQEYEYDYVIVGAASARCVLADRLGADGRCTVLALEPGGPVCIRSTSVVAFCKPTRR